MVVPLDNLLEGQYELSDGTHSLIFGRSTAYVVATVDHETADIRNNDAENAEADGIRMGRDFFSGRMLTFDINLLVDPLADDFEARRLLDIFTSRWRNDYMRTVPGKVSTLRYKLGGVLRRVYGRPRKCSWVSGATKRGWIPMTAEFLCIDDRYYGDTPITHSVTMSPEVFRGLTVPIVAPIVMSGSGVSNPGSVQVTGALASFPVFTIQGPILNPIVDVLGSWKFELRTSLLSDQSLVIDPRTWNRSVLRNDGANLAGSATATSPRLDQLWLEPGEYDIVLRGIDTTGSASMSMEVHESYSSL